MRNRSLLGLILAAAGLPGCGERFEGRACLDVPEDTTTCPDAADVAVADLFVPMDCDNSRVRSISGEGTLDDVADGQIYETGTQNLGCCYTAELVDPNPNMDCAIGRPYREDGAPCLPPLVRRDGGDAPAVSPRAAAWADAGAGEQALVAAFARLALELLAHGAPSELLRAVVEAGRDEVDHARACYTLASRFGGVALAPGPLPFGAVVRVDRDLATVAAEAVRDGCVGETLGAVLVRAAAEAAEDAEVRAVLVGIAADEERHAALSWAIVAWALRVGGPEVRVAVRAAFRAPAPTFDLEALSLRAGVPVAGLTPVVGAAVRDVLRPAAGALLAA